MLPNTTIDYICEDPDLVPHTNKNYTLECVTNSTANEAGKLVSKFNESAPTCVPKNTCRAPWPQHAEYEVETANLKKAYNPGESIQLKCTDPAMVAENRTDKTTTLFSIPCEDNPHIANKPNFTQNPDWARCIPTVCVDYLEHHYNTTGTCNCEFDVCSEYIYDRIEYECPDPGTSHPDLMNGPTCGYIPYEDFSQSIEWYFNQTAPSPEPRTEELDAIRDMKAKCEGVVQFTEDLLSGANAAASTPSTTKRRKRSNVPYFCDDLVFELDKIKTYLEEGNRTGQVCKGTKKMQ